MKNLDEGKCDKSKTGSGQDRSNALVSLVLHLSGGVHVNLLSHSL